MCGRSRPRRRATTLRRPSAPATSRARIVRGSRADLGHDARHAARRRRRGRGAGALDHARAGFARRASERRIERQAARGEAGRPRSGSGRRSEVPSGETRRMPRTGWGCSGAHALAGAHRREDAPAFGRDALAADLVAREVLASQQQDVVAAPARAGRRAAEPAGPPPTTTTSALASLTPRQPGTRRRRAADRGRRRRILTPGKPAAANAARSSSSRKARRIETRPSWTLSGARKSSGKTARPNR